LLTNYSFSQNSNPIASKDSLFIANLRSPDPLPQKKRFWRASGELMLAQIIPWSYNYFVRHADFAKISFESIGHNLKLSSWEWDDNNFKTNQFAHPYQGNLYYSAFRSNGYSFWQSAPAAMAGSLMWEIAGETHPPAPNDLINTTLGGISLGEMTYRVSNVIVNDNHRGFKRQFEEVTAFLINPMNGLNRIIDGKWGRVPVNPLMNEVPVYLAGTLDLGGRRFSEKTEDVFTKGNNEFYMRLKLQYGDPFKDFQKPFSNFSVVVEAGAADSALLNVVQVNGALKGWDLKESSDNLHVATITMNYDYFNNSAFEYGGQSFNFKILSQWKRESKINFETYVGGGIIVLAAVPDDYLYYGEGRNYDYGPGFSLAAGGSININNKFSYSMNYKGGLFKTVNGNESSFFLNTLNAELKYYLLKNLSVSAEYGAFYLNGNYKNYDDVRKKYPFVRLSVGYRLFNR
jgi:hypothetical protein